MIFLFVKILPLTHVKNTFLAKFGFEYQLNCNQFLHLDKWIDRE